MTKKTKGHLQPNQPESPTWRSEVQGLMMITAVILLLLSFWGYDPDPHTGNWIGLFGHYLGWLLHITFGVTTYLLIALLTAGSIRLFRGDETTLSLSSVFYFCTFLASICVLLNLIEDAYPAAREIGGALYSRHHTSHLYHLGGTPFHYLYHDLPVANLSRVLSIVGTAIVFGAAATISLLRLTKTTVRDLWQGVISRWHRRKKEEETDNVLITAAAEKEGPALITKIKEWLRKRKTGPNKTNLGLRDLPPPQIIPLTAADPASAVSPERPARDIALKAMATTTPPPPTPAPTVEQQHEEPDYGRYKVPHSTVLTPAQKFDRSMLKKDLQRQAGILEETLLSFGIEAKVGQINCGPTITSFEVLPAVGVKVQRIKALENDIALNMEARSIRIIAPIPGKAAVGIEIPNPQPQDVSFKELLTHYQRQQQPFHIPILLGKAVNGDYVMSDLTKMPHCIIAGATGSGKSVCINTIVMSILMTARPDQIKLLMVDPKKVELTAYTRLPHMLAPVINDPQEACAALNWLVKEMEHRYDLLKLSGARNIIAFNSRSIDSEKEKALSKSMGRAIPEQMPFIVGIIDELADLMMVSSQDIETPIARIAQMARAVGIHLILATQRPSREVITGLIKANFPTRIAFKVASRINSQIILDDTGAETLLGNGDMLFLAPGTSHLVRVQGAYVSDEDINSAVDCIAKQYSPHYLIKSFDGYDTSGAGTPAASDGPLDPLYNQAYEVIVTTGNASTTYLQRKLKIGYARAASIIDQLEDNRVIGPADGSRARKILVATECPDEV